MAEFREHFLCVATCNQDQSLETELVCVCVCLKRLYSGKCLSEAMLNRYEHNVIILHLPKVLMFLVVSRFDIAAGTGGLFGHLVNRLGQIF